MARVIMSSSIPQLVRDLDRRAEAVVAKAAFDVEAHAKTVVPVDTGRLKNSIQATRVGDLHWRVEASTNYAIYVEMGTRHQAAQPFMKPAADRTQPMFVQACRQLFPR